MCVISSGYLCLGNSKRFFNKPVLLRNIKQQKPTSFILFSVLAHKKPRRDTTPALCSGPRLCALDTPFTYRELLMLVQTYQTFCMSAAPLTGIVNNRRALFQGIIKIGKNLNFYWEDHRYLRSHPFLLFQK